MISKCLKDMGFMLTNIIYKILGGKALKKLVEATMQRAILMIVCCYYFGLGRYFSPCLKRCGHCFNPIWRSVEFSSIKLKEGLK